MKIESAPESTVPKPGSVATPSNISRPDPLTNNFERMQGEWQLTDDPNRHLKIIGNSYRELVSGDHISKPRKALKMVEDCDGTPNQDGRFFLVENRCFKLLSISIEAMEIEDLEQQKVKQYIRI